MRRIAWVLPVLLAACEAETAPAPAPAPDVRVRGAAYLWSKQDPDGGWHSERYGLMRSGQSITPLVLLALLDTTDPGDERVGRAIAFILRNLDESGALGYADPVLLDYPNYATSLAVRALRRAGREEATGPMLKFLRGQQFSEATGWREDHPAFGAWGMGGPLHAPPDTGHLDLSMTRFVLEAIDDEAARRRAAVFVGRCRNEDGGYLFSTIVPGANKGGPGVSYGTATADALLALLAMGVAPSDERVVTARRRLESHHRVDRVPGLDAGNEWADAMLFYYLAAAAEAFRALGSPIDWRAPLEAELAKRQRPDGSWANETFQMKEDDPLIATSFALMAISAARAPTPPPTRPPSD